MKRVVALVVVCLMCSFNAKSGMAGGDDSVNMLRKTVEEQAKIIDELLIRVKALEENKFQDVQALPSTVTSLGDISPNATWAEKVKWKGDFRYRHELINNEHIRTATRNRHRIRARVGLDAKIHDELDFHFQLATGSDDPVSTNQTLDNYFTSKQINLDLAYIDWQPEYILGWNTTGLHAMAGKMNNPFHKPIKTELIWDGDLRPEGGALKYKRQCGLLGYFGSIGGFWLDERSTASDISLWGFQGGVSHPIFNEDIKLVLGASYFDYMGVQRHSLFDNEPFGNSFITLLGRGDLYEHDYDLIEAFWEIHFSLFDMPVAVVGDYVSNVATDHDRFGFLYGFRLNKAKKPGSWDFTYNYRKLDRDATFGAFTDSDFRGGGTDAKGHEISFGYMLAKNTKAATTLFINRLGVDTSGHDYTKWQLDLNVKF